MAKTAKINLQPSETAVVDAASRVLAAWIAKGTATDENLPVMIERAVNVAIELARTTDTMVSADDELSGGLGEGEGGGFFQ